MEYRSDIEIAQATEMTPVTEIAGKLGVDENCVEQYGRYKAKIDYNMLYDMEERKVDIPAASSITGLNCEPGSFPSLIECDTMEYRRYYDSKAVKKTLSIPAWLNTMAEKEDINFSAVLQKALKTELNLV